MEHTAPTLGENMTIELSVYIQGNDTQFLIEWEPDTGIDGVMVSSSSLFAPAPFDTTGLFVASGIFPDTKTVPLIEELTRLGEIAFAENREEYIEMKREEALEHRMEGME